VTLLFENIRKNVEIVIYPRPPIWMRRSMTICPNKDQWVPVSTTTSPVTHVAEVAVKIAVTGSVNLLDALENGNIRRIAPVIITAIKLKTTSCTGVNFLNISKLFSI
jgi:hypothetical protein